MAERSAGNDSKDTSSSASTAQRANTASSSSSSATSSAAAVKAASPITSVRTTGSNTQDNRGANVSGSSGGNSQAFSGSTASGGLAAAANIGGAQTGNRSNQSTADPVDRSPSMNWSQFDDAIRGSPTRSMAQISNDAGMDFPGRPLNWPLLQQVLATQAEQSPRYAGIQQPNTIDNPGSSQDFASYLHDVQNGSMGMPGAVGYGTDGPPANNDPFSGIKTALGSLGSGIDLAGIAHALNGPYLARQAANGGVAPFEGPVDTAGMLRQLNAPYYRANATPGPMDAPGAGPSVQDFAALLGTPDASMASNDRLPTERRVQTSVVIPAYAADPRLQADDRRPDGSYVDPLTAIADATTADVSLPRRDPRGYGDVFATDGQVTTPDGATVRPGVPAQITVHGGDTSTTPAGDKPSAWDKVVDNTGKLLSHTGLGSLVSGMFPDLWNGMGDAFKGVDNGAHGSGTTPIYNPADDNEIATRNHSSQTGGGLLDFIDANGNGIDDRYEGATPAAVVPAGLAAAAVPLSTDTTGFSGNQFRSNRYATFPTMPPYQPGKDNEWNYFHDHLARGGVVGYVDGGRIGNPDPRVTMIADAEDALHRGDHQHPSLDKFVDMFGPKALENLNNNVRDGHRMRAGMPARQITGPGGPTDDAVPAVIDGVHPAKLSSGEVVIPVDAVQGAGDGDPRVGADRLMQLSQRLATK